MRILRFFLLLASVVGAAYIFLSRSSRWKCPKRRTVDSLAIRARTGSQYYFSSILRPGRYWNFAVQLHSSSLVQC
jgi:hypothetical protein